MNCIPLIQYYFRQINNECEFEPISLVDAKGITTCLKVVTQHSYDIMDHAKLINRYMSHLCYLATTTNPQLHDIIEKALRIDNDKHAMEIVLLWNYSSSSSVEALDEVLDDIGMNP
jgi:hypothetical protein